MKLQKYYSKVTPETGLILILATILDPFTKRQIFEAWDREMGMDPEDQASYSRQYYNAFLEYWEQKYVNIEDENKQKEKQKGKEEDEDRSNKGKSIRRIYLLDSSDEEDDCQITEKIQTTPRTASRKSHLMQQARQYLANVPVNMQSAEVGSMEVGDDLVSNDPEEVTASFWYPDIAA